MPDLTFFPDPAVDRVLGVVMELAQEVYALRQKLGALEGTGEATGTEARDAFVARILVPLTYERESPAPEFQAP
jgi:hypothetical protein